MNLTTRIIDQRIFGRRVIVTPPPIPAMLKTAPGAIAMTQDELDRYNANDAEAFMAAAQVCQIADDVEAMQRKGRRP